MKMRLIVGAFAALLLAVSAAQTAAAQDAPADPREMYLDLRNQALDLRSSDLGLTDVPGYAAFGVTMDIGMAGGTATLVGLSSGDASLYLSTGGGVIGGYAHPNVQEAAFALVAALEMTDPAALAPTTDRPLPALDEVRFYVQTDDGLLTGAAPVDELLTGRHPLSNLFFAANDLISELRVIAQSRSGA